eukprot:14466254-Alexandrium_andersonii.AAC.1
MSGHDTGLHTMLSEHPSGGVHLIPVADFLIGVVPEQGDEVRPRRCNIERVAGTRPHAAPIAPAVEPVQ